MAVPSRITDLSATASSNSPAGTDAIGTSLDDYIRAIQSVVRGDLATKGADIASEATTDLGAIQGLFHDITGTATITSFGTVAAGVWKIVKFEGVLTLTHNATSLILPGGVNITTADGDVAILVSEASGNWRCVSYSKADGGPSRVFVGQISRSMTAASGDVAYTGIGFKPKSLSIVMQAQSTPVWSSGFCSAATSSSIYADFESVMSHSAILAVVIASVTAGGFQQASLASFGIDGFTLTWTKVGSPASATAIGYYLASN